MVESKLTLRLSRHRLSADHLINLKLSVKELEFNSRKCEKREAAEKAKCKKAIQKGNLEGAKIYAENAVREKSQALNYLRMSARVSAVASRVQSAITTKRVTSSMANVVKSMSSAMKSMSLEKVSQVMDKFEKQFEDLDVHSSVMESTMRCALVCNLKSSFSESKFSNLLHLSHSSSTAVSMPTNEVDKLMQQIADEAG